MINNSSSISNEVHYFLRVCLCKQSLIFLSKRNKGTLLVWVKTKQKNQLSEAKWFGGIMGGHVGVEKNDEGILHFIPDGAVHFVGQNKNRKSRYLVSNYVEFYQIFGGKMNEHKKLIIAIPISQQQCVLFDSIATQYTQNVPYDYAFKGMRCASAV